ncbi:MAG: hypothetical protein canaca05_06350 [Anaerolineaceae bacterium]
MVFALMFQLRIGERLTPVVPLAGAFLLNTPGTMTAVVKDQYALALPLAYVGP